MKLLILQSISLSGQNINKQLQNIFDNNELFKKQHDIFKLFYHELNKFILSLISKLMYKFKDFDSVKPEIIGGE